MTTRRRFIAGAVCPACGEMDRTVLEIEAALRTRTCIACGHREVLHKDSEVPLPGGRFGRSTPGIADVAPEAVRVVRGPSAHGQPGDPPGHED